MRWKNLVGAFFIMILSTLSMMWYKAPDWAAMSFPSIMGVLTLIYLDMQVEK